MWGSGIMLELVMVLLIANIGLWIRFSRHFDIKKRVIIILIFNILIIGVWIDVNFLNASIKNFILKLIS
jgi:hypothetical protein